MHTQTETRAELIKRCRDLERRFIRIQAHGTNCSIGIMWARQWADAMLDTRGPIGIYINWIEQQEKRANRLEECKHDYASTGYAGLGCATYRCNHCGDEYEKDIS